MMGKWKGVLTFFLHFSYDLDVGEVLVAILLRRPRLIARLCCSAWHVSTSSVVFAFYDRGRAVVDFWLVLD